jgi:acyl-CoA dehydrogenase family protein 9
LSAEASSAENSFMKALFFGVVAEEVVFPFPRLAQPERDRVRELVDRTPRELGDLDLAELDRSGDSSEARARLRALGAFGAGIASDHGGLGLDARGVARLLQEIGGVDLSLGLIVAAHSELAARAIVSHGTPALQARVLPRLASGETLGAFALAERASGSDAGTIQALAEPVAGGGWRLRGTKHWVTNGAWADLFVVFARTSRADEGHKPRIVALVVDGARGVERGARHEMLGVRGSGNCDVTFTDVAVPAENVLGEPGRGYRVAVETLAAGRVALSATLVGQARALVIDSIARVQKRRSFGRAIGEFAIVKDKVARMLTDTFASESMVHLTAGLVDRGVEDYAIESAVCRVAASEALWRTLDEAMRIAAARGYVRPHPFERRLRDARAGFLLDGTNETLRCYVALAGMQAPGRRLQDVSGAMREPLKGFGLLRDFAVRKVREAFRRERLALAHPLLDRETVLFEEAIDDLARVVDRTLRDHGTEIAELQHLQQRVADVVIDLYALVACISRASSAIDERGEGGARREIDLVTTFAHAARGRIQRNLARLEHDDDDLRKAIATRAYADNGYSFDVL